MSRRLHLPRLGRKSAQYQPMPPFRKGQGFGGGVSHKPKEFWTKLATCYRSETEMIRDTGAQFAALSLVAGTLGPRKRVSPSRNWRRSLGSWHETRRSRHLFPAEEWQYNSVAHAEAGRTVD